MSNVAKYTRLDTFKSQLVKDAHFSSIFEFPILHKVHYIPNKAIPFSCISSTKSYDQWLHFYTYDYKFECLWNYPEKYLCKLKRFEGVIAPDFSVYRELPFAMQVWNIYRSRAIAYWLQNNGIKTIPNIRWGDERTYEAVIEGLEQGGTIAISTNGCIRNKTDRLYFKKGLAYIVDALKPDTIVNYSYTPDDIFSQYALRGINIVKIENHTLTVKNAVV